MKKIFRNTWAIAQGKGLLSIRQRVLRLLLLTSLLSFFVFAAISLYGMDFIKKDMSDMGARLSQSGAEYTKQYIDKTSKETLAELAKAKAWRVDRELALMRHDVLILSQALTWIEQHPEHYLPEKVLDPYDGKVPPAEPYIIYSPDLRKRGIETVQREVDLVANIRGTLVPMEKSYGNTYSACYFGSQSGYLICSSIFPGDKYSPISDDADYDYDPRVRPWYVNAINADRPVFSLPYLTILTAEHSDIEVISCSTPYYDSNGIAGVASLDIATDFIRRFVSDTSIGKKGINFIMTSQGEIIFSPMDEGVLVETDAPQDLRTSSDPTVAEIAVRMAKGESGMMPLELYGEEYLIAFAPISTVGWSFGVLVLQDDISSSAQESQAYFLGQMDLFQEHLYSEYHFLVKVALVALLTLFAIIYLLSKRLSNRFVRPIQKMTTGVREIASGDLNRKLDIKTGDELEHLADCFNSMTDELKNYMENLARTTAEKKRIETELNVATDIQLSVLPHDFDFHRDDFGIYATMHAAKEVGGDFYDFYLLDDRHLAITVADVSGKGVPAALFMMRSKTIIKNLALMTTSPDDAAAVLDLANQQLCQDNDELMFVTVFFGVLDVVTGEFIYANGGHNPPLISRKSGEQTEWNYLHENEKSHSLGISENVTFTMKKFTLMPGDMMFLYTDGVTEAMDTDGNLYGEERLKQCLNHTETSAVPIEDILASVRADIKKHVNGADQSDDITMMGIRYMGSGL